MALAGFGTKPDLGISPELGSLSTFLSMGRPTEDNVRPRQPKQDFEQVGVSIKAYSWFNVGVPPSMPLVC